MTTEVTLSEYLECVREGACAAPLTNDYLDSRFPDVIDGGLDPAITPAWMTACDAVRYCAFAGGTVPTLDEWRDAFDGTPGDVTPNVDLCPDINIGGCNNTCTGSDHFIGFPFDEHICGCFVTPVCGSPGDIRPRGFCDMLGNLPEYVFLDEAARRSCTEPGDCSAAASSELCSSVVVVSYGFLDTLSRLDAVSPPSWRYSSLYTGVRCLFVKR